MVKKFPDTATVYLLDVMVCVTLEFKKNMLIDLIGVFICFCLLH